MDDDFNTGGAIGELFEVVHALNRFANQLTPDPGPEMAGRLAEYRAGMVVLKELSQILGLFQRPPAAGQPSGDALTAPLIESLDRAPCPAPQGEELRAGRRDSQAAHRAGRDPGRPARRHALADRAAGARLGGDRTRRSAPEWP